MEFLVMMATREGELAAAHAIKKVFRALPTGGEPAKFFPPPRHRARLPRGAHGPRRRSSTVDGVGGPPVYRRASPAQQFLALAPGAAAGAALLDRLAEESDVDIRGNALLDVVFPAEAYAAGDELDAAQRKAVEAIAASDTAWTFNVNLGEL
jgi:hypothetical protein